MALKTSKLPLSIISKTDLVRMQRELSKLDDFFVSAAARKSGTGMQAPRLTHALESLARENGINLLEAQQRKNFSAELESIVDASPLLHLSFASEPSPKALEVVIAWFRDNIHPQALLQIGIQPTIAAGCVLRTPNQIFDMSVSSNLKNQEAYLAKLIDGAANAR